MYESVAHSSLVFEQLKSFLLKKLFFSKKKYKKKQFVSFLSKKYQMLCILWDSRSRWENYLFFIFGNFNESAVSFALFNVLRMPVIFAHKGNFSVKFSGSPLVKFSIIIYTYNKKKV